MSIPIWEQVVIGLVIGESIIYTLKWLKSNISLDCGCCHSYLSVEQMHEDQKNELREYIRACTIGMVLLLIIFVLLQSGF